jgi:hypothetical protein
MPSAKDKLKGSKSDFDKDTQEIKETLQNEEWNIKRKTVYILKQNSNKLILLGIIGIALYFAVFGEIDVTIPEWVYIVGISAILTSVAIMPIAERIADLFIDDKRKPMLEIGDNGFEVFKLPPERIKNVEMLDGQMNETETIRDKTRAYEVRNFEKIEEKDKVRLVAKGTWEGTNSNLDVKRTWENVVQMRKQLVPQARKAREYDKKMPFWIHKIENEVINDIVYQFENGVTFEGQNIHSKIKEEMGIDDEIEQMNENNENENEKDDIQKMNEQLEEMKEVMENGTKND